MGTFFRTSFCAGFGVIWGRCEAGTGASDSATAWAMAGPDDEDSDEVALVEIAGAPEAGFVEAELGGEFLADVGHVEARRPGFPFLSSAPDASSW